LNLLVRGSAGAGEDRLLSEPEPDSHARVSRGLEPLLGLVELGVDGGQVPVRLADAHECDTAACQLLERVLAIDGLPAERRRLRDVDRKDLLPVADEHTSRID
jgi:hypothetical protein